MATPPPGPGGGTDILGALSDPATLLAVKEFNTRLGQLEESVQKFGARIALTTQEQFLSAIKKLKEETFSDLKATKEYLNDLERAYEQIGTVIEERIKGILKEGVALQENTEKSTEALNKAIEETTAAYMNATPVVQQYYDELGGANAEQKLKKINELTHQNNQELDNAKIALDKATEALKDRNSEFVIAKRNLEELTVLETKKRSSDLTFAEESRLFALQKRQAENLATVERENALLTEQAAATSRIAAAEAEQEKLRAARALQEKQEGVEILEIVNEKNKAQQKILELKKLELAATIPLAEMEKMRVEGLKDVNSKFGSYLEKLSPGAKDTNIFASAMLSLEFATKKTGSGIKNLTDVALAGMKEAFLNPQAAANSFFNLINDKLIKSTFEFDSALASVNRETGGFRKEFEQIATSGNSLVKAPDIAQFANLGMTLEKVGKVYGELSKAIVGFNALSKEERENLTKTAAELNLLGISAQTFSNLNTKFMTSFGVSAEAASRMMKDVAKDAIGLGQDVAKYAEGLNSVMSKVSGYGREATEIYKQLQGISQATKGVISATDLTSISDKFATFDQAADAVSKLNSMLGTTSLNIMDMMQKDPAEQIMAIKKAATDSGLEFDKLNIGYKRLLAEYFGGDINKAAAFFKMDLQEANNLMNKASATEKELEQRKQASVAAQEKMKATMDQFMLSLTPLVNIVNGALTLVNNLTDKIGVIPIVVGIGLLAFYRVRKAVTNIKEQAVEAGEKFKTAFDDVKKSIEAVVAAVEKLNTNLTTSKKTVEELKEEAKGMKGSMAALNPAQPPGTGGINEAADELLEALPKKGFLGKVGGFLKNPLVQIGLAMGGDYLMENADSIFGLGGAKGNDMIFRSAPGRPAEKIADVPSTEVIDFKGAYKDGPLDKMTNFIAGSNTNISKSNIGGTNSSSNSLAQNFFSEESPMVSTLKEFNKSVSNNSNAVKEATMATFDNENFKQVVESTKDVQKMAAEKIATEKQITTNNFTSAINNSELMSREVVNNTQSAVPKDLKMSSTLNINLGNKFIDAITEEVVSKMHSTV